MWDPREGRIGGKMSRGGEVSEPKGGKEKEKGEGDGERREGQPGFIRDRQAQQPLLIVDC